VIIFHIHPGHMGQFKEMTKLYQDVNLKIGQNTPGRLMKAWRV